MTVSTSLPVLLGNDLARDDLIAGIVDVSDTTSPGHSALGTVKTLTADELRYAMSWNDRGVVNPFSIYNAHDLLMFNNGLQVVMRQTAQADVNGFIPFLGANGRANYFVVNVFQMVPAYLTGVRAGGSAATNTLAFGVAYNIANATNANAAGRMVETPYGVIPVSKSTVDGSACVHVPNGCGMYGQGRIATYLQLAAGSNCAVIRLHTSTGSGNANAFFCKLADFGIDGNWANQGVRFVDAAITAGSPNISSTTGLHTFSNGEFVVGPGIPPDTSIISGGGTTSAVMSASAEATFAGVDVTAVAAKCYGILVRTNPLTAQQNGDWGFDPSNLFDNLYLKNCLHTAIRIEGRGGSVVRDILIEQCQEEGINSSFDMHFTGVNIGFCGWHALNLSGSSITLAGVKVYDTGWAAVRGTGIVNTAHGLVSDGRSAIVGSIAIQHVGGSSAKFKNCTAINLQIDASGWGYKGANGLTARAGTFALDCDNVKYSTFIITGGAFASDTTVTPSTGRGYRLVNGTDFCSITYMHLLGAASGTLAPAESADTVRLNNKIEVNAVSINAPGLVSTAALDSAYPKRYSIATSGGSHHNIGMLTTQGIAQLNTLQLVPLFIERGIAQAITELTFRVGTGNVAGAVTRQGVYSSDKNGGNVFTREAELAAPVDSSVTGVIHQTGLTSPIAGDPAKLYWVGSVPQVALAAYQTSMADHLAGSTVNPTGGYCFTFNGVSGSLPATITFSTVTAPVHLSAGISVGVTVTG